MARSDRFAAFSRLRGELDVRAVLPGRPDRTGQVLPTGLAAVDEVLGGGLPQGAVTEIVGAVPSCGSQLLFAQLLVASREARQRVALVDADDAFDPASHDPDLYRHLVWVRCAGVTPALQATDLIVRDANFGLVVLDLRHAEARTLRRTPSTLWYRLQRAVASSALVLLVLTARPTVPSAQLRLELARSFVLDALAAERAGLAARLAPVVQRQRQRAIREEAAG